MNTEQKPHSELEPAALVELATAVGQWLGAESAPDDVIRTQERVVEWAKRLEEQLEAREGERDGYAHELMKMTADRDGLREQYGELQRWAHQVHDALDGRSIEHPDEGPARIIGLLEQLQAAQDEAVASGYAATVLERELDGMKEQLQAALADRDAARLRADEWERAVTEREKWLQEQLEALRVALASLNVSQMDDADAATVRAALSNPTTSSEEAQSSSRAKLDAATAGASATSSETSDPTSRPTDG